MIDGALMEVRELVVKMSDREILSGLDLKLHRGEFVSMIGPNGAGKTTLLRAMDGLVPLSRGEILFEGRSLEAIRRREIARKISYVPQGDPGGLDFSVQAFVELGRYPNLGPWESLGPADLKAVHGAMERTEISALADRRLLSLSGGERQRVLIAAALAQGGDLLLLDEPTSFLDYRHQLQVLALLDRLHRQDGYTCVMVTHDLNAASSLSDRIFVLKEGRLVEEGTPDAVLRPEKLEEVFEVPFRLIERGGKRRSMILAELAPR